MRMRLLMAFALAAAVVPTAFAFNPDDLNRIVFQNSTGTTIEAIFLSPGDSRLWGPDLLGAGCVLENGAAEGYYVHYPGTTFRFDVMAIDEKGNKYEIRGLEIADGVEATVALTARTPSQKSSDPPLTTVRVDNRTGHELQFLFVSPGGSQAWGADLLGEETRLPDGDYCTFVLLAGRGRTRYSLMAVDERNAEYRFSVTINPGDGKEIGFVIEPGDLKSP